MSKPAELAGLLLDGVTIHNKLGPTIYDGETFYKCNCGWVVDYKDRNLLPFHVEHCPEASVLPKEENTDG